MPLSALDGLAIAITLMFAVLMAENTTSRKRAMSHQEYLDTLHQPSVDEALRISAIQSQKESEIDSRYHVHDVDEYQAATRIQKAYRGHRERRQLDGLTLDPSSRWLEAIKEMRYRSATAQCRGPRSQEIEDLSRSPSDLARLNWRRIGQIAGHAGAGETSPPRHSSTAIESTHAKEVGSMLMDLRYFLEMVDVKHRYGTNLQVYHEDWQRSKTTQNFFTWLDHGGGKRLSLPGCSREALDRERIRYLSKEERKDYLVRVDDEGRLRWQKDDQLINTSAEMYKDSVHGIVPKDSQEPAYADEPDGDYDSESDVEPLEEDQAHEQVTKDETPRRRFRVSPATVLNHLLRASIKPGTWIYVVDTLGRLYVGIKSSGAFQHASFLSGARILSAGSIGIEDGQLIFLSPLSGHYRPTTASFKAFIDSLKPQGVDLSHLKVSRAYRLLLGIEDYGKTKSGMRKVVYHKKTESARPPSPIESTVGEPHTTATDVVEQHWQDEHKHGIAKLKVDLHIRRRSAEH